MCGLFDHFAVEPRPILVPFHLGQSWGRPNGAYIRHQLSPGRCKSSLGRRAAGNWSLKANAPWLDCPGLDHARLAEAGPLDLRWRCPSTSLRFLPRIVLRVDVGKPPGTVCADLYNRLFFHGDIVCRAWRKGEETARGQGLELARIGGLAHPLIKRPRDHRDDLTDRMRMRSNAIACGELEPKHKHAFLALVRHTQRRLPPGPEPGRGR